MLLIYVFWHILWSWKIRQNWSCSTHWNGIQDCSIYVYGYFIAYILPSSAYLLIVYKEPPFGAFMDEMDGFMWLRAILISSTVQKLLKCNHLHIMLPLTDITRHPSPPYPSTHPLDVYDTPRTRLVCTWRPHLDEIIWTGPSSITIQKCPRFSIVFAWYQNEYRHSIHLPAP